MTDIRQGPGRFGADLTPRERFRRTMHFQQVDCVSHLEFGYWDELKEQWLAEGHLPASFKQADGTIPDRLVEEYFGCEQFERVYPRTDAAPLRQIVVLERTAETITYRDGLGVLRQEMIAGTRTIPHFEEFPIHDRVSWYAFRDEFLAIDHPAHQLSPQQLAEMEQMSRTTTNPVLTWFGSFIGYVRDRVGFENVAIMSMDDPDLLEEMVAHEAALALHHLPPVLERCQVDAANGWEDICFNSGPILNPRFFAERIMPHMLPVIRLLRQHGVDVNFTDCDGNIRKLIPLWMRVGVNCVFPLERNPGNDPLALRKEYGREILIRGGFNKFALHDGRRAILAELRYLEPLVAEGGFVPGVDHRCPGGVIWDNYCYYIWEKCHMLGWPEEKITAFPALQNWRP